MCGGGDGDVQGSLSPVARSHYTCWSRCDAARAAAATAATTRWDCHGRGVMPPGTNGHATQECQKNDVLVVN